MSTTKYIWKIKIDQHLNVVKIETKLDILELRRRIEYFLPCIFKYSLEEV